MISCIEFRVQNVVEDFLIRNLVIVHIILDSFKRP